MILDKEIEIKVNSTSIKHYKNKGYGDIKIGDNLLIKIEDLTSSSSYKINVMCDVCGTKKSLRYHNYLKNIKNTGTYCCSNKCAYKVKNEKSCLEKHGNKNYNNTQKRKKTCLERYGVENVFQNEEIKNKIKKANINKYGDESHNRNEEIKNNKKQIFLKKYGVSCYLNTIEQKEKSRIKKLRKYGNLNNHNKIKDTFLRKYGVEHPSQVNEFKEKRIKNYKKTIVNNILFKYENIGMIKADFEKDKFIFNCEKGHQFEISRDLLKNRIKCHTLICTQCNPVSSHVSGQEILFNNYIREIYSDEMSFNDKNIIYPYELDIYLPKEKISFEFNGLYWHDEIHRENNYHLNKTELTEKKGIRLIHVYEDDWIYKQEIVKSRIKNLLNKTPINIYARKCEIKEIFDNNIIKNFLETNHLQGFVNSKIKIGLFYNNELMSLMTFGNLRKLTSQKSINNSYEILRFCNKTNTNVIGGASRLFKYFINKFNPKEIISYADRSWSQGDIYNKLKFELVNKTKPNYFYIIKGIRKHRFNFRKDKLVKQGFESHKTEHEIMLERKIYRIYDSGNLKYYWKNNI